MLLLLLQALTSNLLLSVIGARVISSAACLLFLLSYWYQRKFVY
ncbi:MAG: hypothetical protein WCC10_17210 [Tumebacillaceae bacterium]